MRSATPTCSDGVYGTIWRAGKHGNNLQKKGEKRLLNILNHTSSKLQHVWIPTAFGKDTLNCSFCWDPILSSWATFSTKLEYIYILLSPKKNAFLCVVFHIELKNAVILFYGKTQLKYKTNKSWFWEMNDYSN